MTPFEENVRATRIKLARASIQIAERYVAMRPGADASATIRALIEASRDLIDELQRPPTAKETP